MAAHGGRVVLAAEVLALIGSLELLRVAFARAFAYQKSDRVEFIIACIPFVRLNFFQTVNLYVNQCELMGLYIASESGVIGYPLSTVNGRFEPYIPRLDVVVDCVLHP